MKSRVIIIIGLFSVLTIFGSCAKNENPDLSHLLLSEYSFFISPVTNVAPPASIAAGVPATFSASYIKPSPCYYIVGIKTYQDGLSVNLYVLLDLPNPPTVCSDVLVGETSQFQIVFPQPGAYTISYKGTTGPESIEVIVK